MIELAGDAERCGEIVRPDEKSIHARHAQDRVNIPHGFVVFDLDEDDALLVEPAVVDVEFIRVTLRPRQPYAARADGRIFHRRHNRRGLLRRVDRRGDDPVRAGVHHALDDIGIVAAHADERADAREVDGADEFRRAFEGDGAVLEIDGEPVETGAHHDLGDGWVGNRDPRAEGRAAEQFVFGGAAEFHGGWWVSCS